MEVAFLEKGGRYELLSPVPRWPWLFTLRRTRDALLTEVDLLLGWLGALLLLLTYTGEPDSNASEVSGELELLDCESLFSWHCCLLQNQNVSGL